MAVSPVGRVLKLSRVLYSIPQYEDDIEIPGPKVCEPPFLALFDIFDICSRLLSAETVLHPNELRRTMERRRNTLLEDSSTFDRTCSVEGLALKYSMAVPSLGDADWSFEAISGRKAPEVAHCVI